LYGDFSTVVAAQTLVALVCSLLPTEFDSAYIQNSALDSSERFIRLAFGRGYSSQKPSSSTEEYCQEFSQVFFQGPENRARPA
jgi:hypothetical protein